MGQLERYGLYVLCVVIVLILGVAIWGGDPAEATTGVDLDTIAQQVDDDWGQTELGSADLDATIAPPAAPPGDGFFENGSAGSSSNELDIGGDFEEVTTVEQGTANPQPTVSEPPRQAPANTTANNTAPVSMPQLRKYKVRKGDTMERIAKRELGSIKYVKRIQELNPGVVPEKMQLGQELTLPWVEGASSPDPDAATAAWRNYTVKKDDTAYDISIEVYGTARHMKKILQANGIKDPKRLKPGQVLRIPPKPEN